MQIESSILKMGWAWKINNISGEVGKKKNKHNKISNPKMGNSYMRTPQILNR